MLSLLEENSMESVDSCLGKRVMEFQLSVALQGSYLGDYRAIYWGRGVVGNVFLFKISFGWNFSDKPCGSYALVKLKLTFSTVQIWTLLHLETF